MPNMSKKFRFNHLSSLPDDLTLKNLLEIRKNQPQPGSSAGPSSGASAPSSEPGPSGIQRRLGEKAPLRIETVPSNSKLMFKILFGLIILSLSLHVFHLCIYEPVIDNGRTKDIQSSLKELRNDLEVAMESQMDFSREELLNNTKNLNESFNLELNLTKETIESQMDFLRQELQEMNDKLVFFKHECERVIDWVALENEKFDHSGTRPSSASMVVPTVIPSLVGFVVIMCAFQL